MFIFCLTIEIAYSKLIAYNTQSKTSTLLSYTVLPFGDPALYSINGRAAFPTALSDDTDLKDMFAIISNPDTDSLVELALLSQNAGAIGVIFQTDLPRFIFNYNKGEIIENITIPCLIIKNTNLKTSEEHLWISYKYDLIVTKEPLITLTINGDYASDKPFIQALFNLHSKIKFSKTDLIIQIEVLDFNDAFINPATDCLVYHSNYVCMASTSNATGKQRLTNSIYLANVLERCSDLTIFFTSILSFYEKCEFDYSLGCIEANLKATPSEIPDIFNQGSKITSLQINSRYIFKPVFIEAAYCLSSVNPSENCTRCNENCAFDDLINENCDEGCNVAACGFDNLKCLNNKITESDICTPGCLYSDIEKGLCPTECTGSCFEYCDSTKFCSPGCAIDGSDFENCKEDCHAKRLLYCDSNCADEYDSNGYCPSGCSSDCCEGKDSSSGTVVIAVAVSVPLSVCCW